MATFLHPLLRRGGGEHVLANGRTAAVLASRVEPAFVSRERRRGLLGRAHLAPNHAMVLAPCNAVHTCFMRFPIDIVFADRRGRVLAVRRAVRAWRVAFARGAFATIELPAGTIDRTATRPGDTLTLRVD